ncbi:MAG: aspartate kinase [Coriobacteriia bacterium]|nr:aspartate kinase [Coriobacteriia bacterium]
MMSVAERLVGYRNQGHRVVAVVSAMGKTTDDLIALANSVNSSPPSRELDNLLATGEQVSMAILAMAIDSLGVPAVSLSGGQAGIVTTTVFSKAQISEINAERILAELDKGCIVVVAGFQGITPTGDITTLGRGGSDTTAVAVAAAIKADVCEIYSDVDGVYSADPRLVPMARKLDEISYEEMLELSAAGSGVLQGRAVEVARNFGVQIICRNAFNNTLGTLVREEESMEEALVTGVASDKSQSKVTIRGVPDRVGVAAEVFTAIAEAGVSIDMIVQNISEGGSTDISFTLQTSDIDRLQPVMNGLVLSLGIRGYITDDNIAKVSIVGAGMRSNPGIAAQMFRVLADQAINIEMISTSSIRISVVIAADRTEDAMVALHTGFGLDSDQVFEETQLSAEELAAKMAKGR